VIRVPIAIVAHPKRNAEAMRLAAQVDAEALCWDLGEFGAEHNHLQAWRWLAEEDSEWCVVLEDDVIPCSGFLWQLRDALAHAPSPIVSLYLGRGRPPHWQESIARAITDAPSFLTAPAMLSCQGYAMRTELFRGYNAVKFFINTKRAPIDEAMTLWIGSHTMKGSVVSYPVPSLIDHRDGPTLVQHWDGPRNGTTALLTHDSDPSGMNLPEIRRAWQFGPHTHWSSTSIGLDIPLTLKETSYGHEARRPNGRSG
jgi:GR25 family glycosyltransferase involved in LPS biosynthesis